MKIASVGMDPKAVEDGEWVANLPEMDDLKLKCRGQNSSVWRTLARKQINALPRNLRNRPDGVPMNVQDQINNKCIVGAGLLDWENMELGPQDWERLGMAPQPNPVPYSRELAEKIINHPYYFLIRDACLIATTRVGAAAADADEELVGNSRNSSDGNSATQEPQAG